MQFLDPTTKQSGAERDSLSPPDVILHLYELGIESCRNKDSEKLAKIIEELVGALNFDYYDIANSFYELYRFVSEAAGEGDFEQAIDILSELRDVWRTSVLAMESRTKKEGEVKKNGH